MKKTLLLLLVLISYLISIARVKRFRFAFLSDTHIGSPNGNADETS